MATPVPPAELEAAVARLDDWSIVDDAIIRTIEFATFRRAMAAVAQVGEVAERLGHHPDIDVRWRAVSFRCSTHSAGRITDLDIELAAQIDRIANEIGSDHSD